MKNEPPVSFDFVVEWFEKAIVRIKEELPCCIISALQARIKEMERALKIAKEAMTERRGYAADAWDWKYGKVWDKEDAAVEQALKEKA